MKTGKTFSAGFTGTQKGMTLQQKFGLVGVLCDLDMRSGTLIEFHHGDCIGADAQMHDLVRALYPSAIIHIHPSTMKEKRAFKTGDIVYAEKPPLVRNHDIADSTRVMLGAPKEFAMTTRSGTWATIRYAHACMKPLRIIDPNGERIFMY